MHSFVLIRLKTFAIVRLSCIQVCNGSRPNKSLLVILTVRKNLLRINKCQKSFKVKRVAEEKYNYTFGNESVSTFVTAFYDAVLLYGLALNETLEKGGNQSDGEAIVKAMWGKTFTGITGEVNIDSNGDRIADYSLLDMDPETYEFKVRIY